MSPSYIVIAARDRVIDFELRLGRTGLQPWQYVTRDPVEFGFGADDFSIDQIVMLAMFEIEPEDAVLSVLPFKGFCTGKEGKDGIGAADSDQKAGGPFLNRFFCTLQRGKLTKREALLLLLPAVIGEELNELLSSINT